jgi:hypothetical protein
MVHASGYSQIGLARKNPDENHWNGNPSNRRLDKARYFCARCVGWLRLAVSAPRSRKKNQRRAALVAEVRVLLSRARQPDLRHSGHGPTPCRRYVHLQQPQRPNGQGWYQLPVQLGLQSLLNLRLTAADHKGSGSRTGARFISRPT